MEREGQKRGLTDQKKDSK